MAEIRPETGRNAGAAVQPVPQTGAAGRIRNYFLTGLVVAGPLLVTV